MGYLKKIEEKGRHYPLRGIRWRKNYPKGKKLPFLANNFMQNRAWKIHH